ncbi:hypothetical protein SprV_0401658800 [Sparganum proliferum]
MRRQAEMIAMREEERKSLFGVDSSEYVSSEGSEPAAGEMIILKPGSVDFKPDGPGVDYVVSKTETVSRQESELSAPSKSGRTASVPSRCSYVNVLEGAHFSSLKPQPELRADAGATPVFTKRPPKKRRKVGGAGHAPASRLSQVLIGEGFTDEDLTDEIDEEEGGEEEEEEEEEEHESGENELSIELLSESSSADQASQNYETDEALLDPEARKSARLLKRFSSMPKYVIDSPRPQDSATFLEAKVALLESVVTQDWFPEPDILLEPNRIAAVVAGTLMNMPFDGMPVAVAMINSLMRNFPLMDDCLLFVLYCLRKAYHRCVDHLRRHVHIEDPLKSNLVDIARRIINILADNGMEATPYILKLVFASEHRMDKANLLEEEDEDLRMPPSIPVVPDVDLKHHLEVLRQQGPVQKPATLSDISEVPSEVTDDSFGSGIEWDGGRDVKVSQRSRRSLQPSAEGMMMVRGERTSDFIIKPVGLLRRRDRRQYKDPSKVARSSKNLAVFSEEAKKKLPVLKTFLNSKTNNTKGTLTTAEELIHFLNTSESTPEKRELINACQEILEMDPAMMGEMRNLMLNQMDSIPSKIGQKSAIGKTFNFLNLFKTAFTPTRRKTLAAEPQLRSIFVNALMEELKRGMNEIRKLTTVQRVLWLSLPENYEQTAETYRQIAKIIDENELQESQRETIVQFVLQDMLDSIALLNPSAGLSEQERQVVFDRCIGALDVLEWFGIETKEFAEKLAMPTEKLTAEKIEVLKKYRTHVLNGEKALKAKIKAAVQESVWNELSPTLKKAQELEVEMDRMKQLLDNSNPVDRALWLTLPEVTQTHRDLYKNVGELIHAGAMTPELRTKVISGALQNLCDLILVVYNKNDFKKEDRQMAYNQSAAISEMLRWFGFEPTPFKYELQKHTDLEDRYKAMSPESLVTKVARKIAGVRTALTVEEDSQGSPTNSLPESPQRLRPTSSSSALQEPEIQIEVSEASSYGPSPVSGTSKHKSHTHISPGDHVQSKKSAKGLKALLEIRASLQVEGRKPKSDSFWSDSISSCTTEGTKREVAPSTQPASHGRHVSSISPSEEKTEMETAVSQHHGGYGSFLSLTGEDVLPSSFQMATTSLETAGEGETSETLPLKSLHPTTDASVTALSTRDTDTTDVGYTQAVQKRILNWSVVSKIPQYDDVEPEESESSKFLRTRKKLHYAAILSNMPADMLASESQPAEDEDFRSTSTFAPSEMRRSIGSAISVKTPGSLSEVSLLRAARLLLDLDPKKTHKVGRDKKLEIRKQMRLNLILQHLRKNLAPTEIAELFADLHTGKPSKRTQLLLEESGRIVDAMMELGIKGTGLQDSSQNYPNDPSLKAHCPSDMLAKMGINNYGIKPVDIMQRADVIGYISKAIQDRVADKERERARLMSYIMSRTHGSSPSLSGSSYEKGHKILPVDEMKIVVSKLRAIFKDDRKFATVLVQALEENDLAISKLKSYVGTQEAYEGFMNSIFSSEWVFMFLAMFFGSEGAVMDCIDLLQSESADPAEVEAAKEKVTNAVKDYRIIEDFLDLFNPLVQQFTKALEPAYSSLEEARDLVKRFLSGEEAAMKTLEQITRTERDELTMFLETIRRCDEYQFAVLCEGIQLKILDFVEERKREEEMHKLSLAAKQAEEERKIRIAAESPTLSSGSRRRQTPRTATSSRDRSTEEELLMLEPDHDFFQPEAEPETPTTSSADAPRKQRVHKASIQKKAKVRQPLALNTHLRPPATVLRVVVTAW